MAVGDAVRGLKWPETDPGHMLRVEAKHLSKLNWQQPEASAVVGSHTYTCTEAQWRELRDTDGCVWQMTDMLDGAILLCLGFMRRVFDVPVTDPKSDDTFYTVMLVVAPDAPLDAPTDLMKLSQDSVVLLLPRSADGHPYLVVSAEPTGDAVLSMQNWARSDSTMMMVSA